MKKESFLALFVKGFQCGGVEGEDVGKLLNEALRAAHLKVSVVAVLNDTTGKLSFCFLFLIHISPVDRCSTDKVLEMNKYTI